MTAAGSARADTGEEITHGVAVSVTALRADQIALHADHARNLVGGGAERTVEVRLGAVDEQIGSGVGGEFGNPASVAETHEPAVHGDAEKTGESDGKAIGETVAVSVVEDAKPIEQKHGDSYGLGFLIGLSLALAITYAVFRKKSNRS